MATQAIPNQLIERLKAGRVALVVGAGLGTAAGRPSWKKLFEKLAQHLEQSGAKSEAADVTALLKRGRKATVAGFLERRLGPATCAKVLGDALADKVESPEVMKLLARLPVRAFISTSPGPLLPQTLTDHAPAGVDAPLVVTGSEIDGPIKRKRFVLKALGDVSKPDSITLSPRTSRKLVAERAALRAMAEDLWRNWTLLFVGFRGGDADLGVLLDGFFASASAGGTAQKHVIVAPGLGPIEIDELTSMYGAEPVSLDGDGSDEKHEALTEWLKTLAESCTSEGLILTAAAIARPSDDDLEGWLARFLEDTEDSDARDALDALERKYREAADYERLVELLLGRLDGTPSGAQRAGLLRQVALVFEHEIGDLQKAFTALSSALSEEPASDEIAGELERLAGAADLWSELVADVAALVAQVESTPEGKKIAARHCARLGTWYIERLRHRDYAISAFEQALRLDPTTSKAREGLHDLYRQSRRWDELADSLRAGIEHEPDTDKKVDAHLALGDIFETELKDSKKAVDAFKQALVLDPDNQDALAALERNYRKDSRWEDLAQVLGRRAELVADASRSASMRREIGDLLLDRLGDVDGAITRYEHVLETEPANIDALRALEKLYDRVGKNDKYLSTLEHLADALPGDADKVQIWRRLAAEYEEDEGRWTRAAEFLEKILAVQTSDDDAYRALARLYKNQKKFEQSVDVMMRHVGSSHATATRIELWAACGRTQEELLSDPHRAIEAWSNVLDLDGAHRDALTALGRLYKRIDSWDRAAAMMVKNAEAAHGKQAVELWHEAGELAASKLSDEAAAESRFVKALELDPQHVASMLSLVELYRRRGEHLRAARLMVEAEGATTNRIQKVKLLHDAGTLYEDHLDNRGRAAELYAKALSQDPEHVEAAARLCDIWSTEQRWAEVEPILDMLVKKIDRADRHEFGKRERQLAVACENLGNHDKAAKHYRSAVEAEPDDVGAIRGLADILFVKQEYEEADKRYRALLALHRAALAEGEVVELYYRLGVGSRHRGDDARARESFQKALAIEPGHKKTLAAMMEFAQAQGDVSAIIDAKRALLEGAGADERFKLYTEIGDLYAEKQEDPVSALSAYLEALKIRPSSHQLLHKVLELYVEQKAWKHAVDTLGKLSEQEHDAARRAKYNYTAGVICRDELKAIDDAVERFHATLDDTPEDERSFDAIRELQTAKQDWKALAKSYRKQLKRLPAQTKPDVKLRYWTALADLALDKLDDRESGIAALEVATTLEENADRRARLAALYLQAGPSYLDKAIVEQQRLLKLTPDKLDLYRNLDRLYRETKAFDKAWCLAAALCFLGGGDDEDKKLFEQYRPKGLIPARHRLTEELWQKAIIHPREDRYLSGMFAALAPAIIATTAQPHQTYGLNRKQATDPAKDDRMVAKIFRYVVNTLGVAPPELYFRPEQKESIQVANTHDKGILTPSFVVGAPVISAKNERELAFEMAKRIAFLRPERYVRYALPTSLAMANAYDAAVIASGAGHMTDRGPEVDKLTAHFKKTVAQPVLDQVASFAKKIPASVNGMAVTSWLSAADLTANRVGFIVVGDLESAATQVSKEPLGLTTLSTKDRLKDLLAYSVSEEYFSVRRHLGLEINVGTGA